VCAGTKLFQCGFKGIETLRSLRRDYTRFFRMLLHGLDDLELLLIVPLLGFGMNLRMVDNVMKGIRASYKELNEVAPGTDTSGEHEETRTEPCDCAIGAQER
jgi:hypothetical protein